MSSSRTLVGFVAALAALLAAAPASATRVSTSSDRLWVGPEVAPLPLGVYEPSVNVTVTRTSLATADVVEDKSVLLPLNDELVPSRSSCHYAGSLRRMTCSSVNLPETSITGSTSRDRIELVAPYGEAFVSSLGGHDVVSVAAGAAVPELQGFSQVDGGDGDDVVTLSTVPTASPLALVTALGGPGNDRMVSKPGGHSLWGGPGFDVFQTRDGDDDDVIMCPEPGEPIDRDAGDLVSVYPGCTP